MARICPECQTQYDDDVAACPKDGEELVEMPAELQKNPSLLEVVASSPADCTSMIDLEALEAKRKAKVKPEDGGGGESDDEKTPPPEGPIEEDREATGTLQRTRGKKKKEPTVVAPRDDDDDIPSD